MRREHFSHLVHGHQITGSTPELHLAAKSGDLETVRLLTDKEHQNSLQKDKYGDTALHAVAWGGSLDVLKYFIDERNCNPACLGEHSVTHSYVKWLLYDHIIMVCSCSYTLIAKKDDKELLWWPPLYLLHWSVLDSLIVHLQNSITMQETTLRGEEERTGALKQCCFSIGFVIVRFWTEKIILV